MKILYNVLQESINLMGWKYDIQGENGKRFSYSKMFIQVFIFQIRKVSNHESMLFNLSC